MNFLKFLATSTPQGAMAEVAGGAAEGLIAGIGEAAVKIRQAFKGKEIDPDVAAQVDLALAELNQTLLAGQMAINLEDAKSQKWWQAGWRPNIGWACGGAIWYSWVIQPFLTFGIQVAAWLNAAGGTPFPPLPRLSMEEIIGLTVALLGMGTLRTLERTAGKA